MSYIDKNLLGDERLYYRTKQHWIIFILPAILTLISLLFLLTHNIFMLLMGYFLLIFVTLQWVGAGMTYNSSEYGVSDKRIFIKVGSLRSQSLETLLNQVAGITVKQSMFGRIFGFGTIVIKSTGGAFEPYHMVVDPMEFRRKVQEQIVKNNKETENIFE